MPVNPVNDAWAGTPESDPYSLQPRVLSPERLEVIRTCLKCKCGHAERWHNKPYGEGGANWAPIGCYYETEPERPTICGCPKYRAR
jgi:hypothetical protein